MALDDAAIDRQFDASMLKAFRQDYGARGNRDAIEGAAYSTGKYFSAVLDTETRNVLIENPANSGKVLFPSAAFRAGGQILFHKVDSPTIDTAGTTVDIDNRRIANGTSVARVESEVAFSGGNGWTRKVSGGAKEGGGLAPSKSRDFDILLDEGERVVYQLENVSGAETKATIDVDYVEIEREKINELVE
jgi:hypothetical protein